MKKRVSILFCVAIALLSMLLFLDTTFAKDESYTLRVSMVITKGDNIYEGYAKFKEGVEARTNGKIKVELYPRGVLGRDEEMLEQAVMGGEVCVNTDAGRLGVWVKEIGILLCPYLTDSIEDWMRLLKSDLAKEWYDKVAKERGLVVLAFNWYAGARHFLTKKPIYKPEDLEGLKVRTPGAPVWQETIRALGATPVALPWTEVYMALQQGVVDGAEAQHPATYGSKLYEVAKYITKTGHIQLWNCPVVGEKWLKKLPADYQKILFEEADKAGDYATDLLLKMLTELEEKMKAEGAVINEVDLAPFKKRAEVVYEKLGYQDIREKVLEFLSKK
ncbi:MAG: TRAP dicarboxylate transporter, DctP subunit [bacterium 42_11]|nr:MAG: TRAP dicarboxylate transporter, DctP subunit [bacterium 42_11]